MTCTSSAPCDVITKAEQGGLLRREEISGLISLSDSQEIERLYQAADRVRAECVGEEIFLRGIIEFSNYCMNNCRYCGLRRDNMEAMRYRMEEGRIMELAQVIKGRGCGTVVLQSGEDPYYTGERMCGIIARIKDETGLAITLSLGQRPFDDYKAFREAGADRYLLRHETANPVLFAGLCPGRSLDGRIQCLKWLGELDYEVGMGCMVGLPGQTVEDLADDVLLIRELGADMIGIGPFIPHEDTPLRNEVAGDTSLVLKMLAVIRLVTRDTNIPSTTALGVLDGDSRRKAFQAGANVFMPVFTPRDFAERYDIYPGKGNVKKADGAIIDFKAFFDTIGRPVGEGPGGRRKRS
ncbi:MAG: [FeFe] hydrogenase H-cluster radical SAM maturase HydE [Desulfobacterota bacterium]|nr:[FeFe] hydrogenase H-cluster radical SAM maturase HydE [Thermodesulfobacteriota bacterium]